MDRAGGETLAAVTAPVAVSCARPRRPSDEHPGEPQARRSRRGRARGSRSAPPGRPRPCRGCRARRSRSSGRSPGRRRAPISAASVPCSRARSGTAPSGSTETTCEQAYAASSRGRAGRRDASHVAGRDEPASDRDQVRARSRPGSREAARSPARAGARRRGTARRSRARPPRASSPSASGRRRRRPTSRRRRRRRDRSRRRAARARAARRSRNSPGWRSAGRWGARAPAARSTSPRCCRGGRSRTRRRKRRIGSRCAPERSTTTAPAGGSSAAAASWSRQQKISSAPAASASAFGTNAGSGRARCAPSRGSSAAAGSPGERVGAERDQLELRVGEHAVERLLPGEAGRAEDGGRDHLRIMQKSRIYATGEQLGSRSGSLMLRSAVL